MNAERSVVITGMGVLSPIGLNVEEVKTSLLNVYSGIASLNPLPLTKTFPAGVIPHSFEDQFTKLELAYLDRCQQLAVLAARQAVTDSGLPADFSAYGQRAGVYYGNVNGGMATEQVCYRHLLVEGKQALSPFSAMSIMCNSGAAQISIRHQILGQVVTNGSACVSSGMAIGEAVRAIRNGYLDVAIAGGAEAALTAGLLGTFVGMRALAALDEVDVRQSCRPFSQKRTGLVMGEGAVFFVLESQEHAQRRAARCYATVSGYGIASDGYHLGVPKEEGQVAAIRAALADAQITPEQLDYFNAHATATQNGDVVESNAIATALGDAVRTVPVSATKSVHGHLLGAASALELLITVVAMKHSFLPATAYLDDIDERCALCHVPNQPILDRPIEHALSFSCGFGGTNVALIVSKHRETIGNAFEGSVH